MERIRARAPPRAAQRARRGAGRHAAHRSLHAGVGAGRGASELHWSMASELASAEGDDAANGIVGRNTDGDAITRHYLDAEAAHPAAQLCEHLVARIHLHAVQPAAV